jgi:hypothetical protein
MDKEKLLEMAEKDPHGLMVDTLREIAEIKGAFNLDAYTHAINTIRGMQKLALTTLFAIHEISEDEIKELELGSR